MPKLLEMRERIKSIKLSVVFSLWQVSTQIDSFVDFMMSVCHHVIHPMIVWILRHFHSARLPPSFLNNRTIKQTIG
jgi:hypothetical protein